MKQRSLFDIEGEAPPVRTSAPKATPAPAPKMIRGAVYQPDYSAIGRARPTKPQGARGAGACAYCGELVWHVGVTTQLSGSDYSGHATHHTPELVWLDGGGFGWVWVWHAKYCKVPHRGGPTTFSDTEGP